MAEKRVTANFEGGDKLRRYLGDLARKLGEGAEARVGFLEGATYANQIEKRRKSKKFRARGKNAELREQLAAESGLHVAQVAFWNEYGTKFVPERPFFRNMIEDQAPTWAKKLAIAVRYTGYRSRPALEILAADIKGHLVESINMMQDPPLAPYTIERKGFAKPLIDTAVMIRAADWQVITGLPIK